ncbi:oxidase EvaA [Saccharothrix ecbatanensis]|uniref:Oxidase EvaA n=1 Tax=Saccharothrix ecbatanensis TaxID=1105145 RepID=A0A7W9HK80_9PSEU|nr:NDP-hexose 2,3-dehydratase family protein [Saccharothrix ecbatanensis]MBB5803611.1 oxidase EvaA [Saccharothrix ecbatanensis]
MPDLPTTAATLVRADEHRVPELLAGSALDRAGGHIGLGDFWSWFTDMGLRSFVVVEPIPLTELSGWTGDFDTGNISHHTGKFFSIEGLDVQVPGGPVTGWSQPIINQPEIGILGILVKQFDGVLHCLMQAKVEPGNANGLQLSPTVQATRSNYTQVHKGKAVPYLDYFRDTSRHRVITDVRQSEQGSWFYHKRNRNMVVEVTEDVEVVDGFVWLTLGQLHALLAVDDLVNMDARTVLSCLPFSGVGLVNTLGANGTGFQAALVRSCGPEVSSVLGAGDVLSWITDVRSRAEVHTSVIPLRDVRHWHRTGHVIAHDSGRFFDVMAVRVRAEGREVQEWTQPMIKPIGEGVVAFLVSRIGGVLHVLVHALVQPGCLDVAELAPTVQCAPENYAELPAEARPRFLDDVLAAPPERIRYDVTLSEEGGRFYHARNRYVIAEVEAGPAHEHPDFRWMTVHQLVELLRHSHYVNVEARSLLACLQSLSGGAS